MEGLGGDRADRIGRKHLIGLGQGQPFARIPERAGPIAEGIGRRQLRMLGPQTLDIATDDHIAPTRDRGSRREGEGHPVLQTPSRQIHRLGRPIVQLDELLVVVLRNRMVHELVEHHVLEAARGIGLARSERFQTAPTGGPIGCPTQGHSVFLPPETNGIEDAHSIRTDEPDGLPGRAEAKTEGRLIEHEKATGRHHGARRHAEAVGPHVVRQRAPGQIGRLGAAVVEFDRVELRQVGVGQDLVENHTRGRIFRRHRIHLAGIAAPDGARRPRAGIGLAVARIGEHQRMTGSVGGDRPGIAGRELHRQFLRPEFIPQFERTSGTIEAAGIGPQDIADPLSGHHRGRILGHDHELPRAQAEPFRELKADRALDLPTGKVFEHLPGIVQLHELQSPFSRKGLRMILDFAEHDPRPATGQPQAFTPGLIGHLTGSGHRAVLAEPNHRHGIGVTPPHGQADLHGIRHRNGARTERSPAGSIERSEGRDRVAVAAQTQPRLRIIGRVASAGCGHGGIGPGRGSTPEETPDGG